MSEEKINIIKEQLYLENGNRASYIDITGEEAEEFIEAVEKLLEENKDLKQTIDELAKENEKWIDAGLDYVKRHFKDYIHKDKIKNKIEDVAEELQIYVDTEEFDKEFEKTDYTIKVLKELLGE